jgi:hypothetical protein
LVSDKIKDLILNYSAENENPTENDVVRYMKDYHGPLCRLTRVPTLAEINKFEEFQKINVSNGDRQGQAHHVSINNDNKFTQIKKDLEEIEPFIKVTNEYFRRCLKEDLEENEEISKGQDEFQPVRQNIRFLKCLNY